jgi:hypothetical protein
MICSGLLSRDASIENRAKVMNPAGRMAQGPLFFLRGGAGGRALHGGTAQKNVAADFEAVGK